MQSAAVRPPDAHRKTAFVFMLGIMELSHIKFSKLDFWLCIALWTYFRKIC